MYEEPQLKHYQVIYRWYAGIDGGYLSTAMDAIILKSKNERKLFYDLKKAWKNTVIVDIKYIDDVVNQIKDEKDKSIKSI